MGKVKIKKSDIWIDMTPMSDVMTLLLTFFMLTSTFIKNEPVKVNTPGTVSETKVPESSVITITVNPVKGSDGKPTGDGQVFLGMSNADELGKILEQMYPELAKDANLKYAFSSEAQFGVALKDLQMYLSQNQERRSKILLGQDPQIKAGIPLDSIDGEMSEFQRWISASKAVNNDLDLVIKAANDTPYKTVKKVMSELQDMSQSHYYLSTQLDGSKVTAARSYIEKSTGGSK
jgi:biopolymer transport protein ExbD